MMNFFIGISMVILVAAIVSAVHKYIDHRAKGSISSDAEKRLNERMDEIEHRLTDIQDILIAIDEKFDRPTRQ